MNLRQIVRNQKLQNYSLYGVIGEAKDDDEAAAVDADAGVTPAGSKKFWFTNNDGDYIDRVEDPGAGWRLADKNDAEKSVKKGKSKKSKEEEPKTKSKKKKEYDWRGEKHEPEGENGHPSPAQINDLRTQMFDGKPGRSSDWAGEAQSTPTSKPPSDAMARQTAIDLGFPTPKGTTRGPSQITGEMAAPAPGNPGSMMNEVFSVEGCNVAEAFYERFGVAPTVEEMEGILQEQFGNSQLA